MTESQRVDMIKMDIIQSDLEDRVSQAPIAQVAHGVFLHAIFKVLMLCARKYLRETRESM